jgi:hypothetical protein
MSNCPELFTSRRSPLVRGTPGGLKDVFDWTVQSIDLLTKLMMVLSETNKAWEVFASPGGDISYLQYAEDSPKVQDQISHTLEGITHSFEGLKYLQRRLISLNERCHSTASIVGIFLSVVDQDISTNNM